MTSKYLKTGEQRAELVEELFAKIARRYDLVNDVMTAGMHRAWKRELVQRSGFSSGKRALDLCCGTGDIAFLLAARAMNRMEERGNGGMGAEGGNVQRSTLDAQRSTKRSDATTRLGLPASSIVGLDFTEPMLRLADSRARVLQTHGHEAGLAFVRGDALRLPFPDATFDVVTVGYGLRNLADLRAGLMEIHRVLKRGGIFLSLDMGKPANRLWRKIFFTHLRLTLPALGWLFLRDADAYRYLVDSLEIYPAQGGVKMTMEEIGFVELGVKDFCGGGVAINYGKKSS